MNQPSPALLLLSTLAVPVALVAAWLVERRRPARAFMSVAAWTQRGVLFFLLTAAIGSSVPKVWEATGLTRHAVLHLQTLGLWGVPIGLLVVTFIDYWLHRAEHRFSSLWMAAHQLHHSAQRVDIAGAFFTHPVEVVLKVSVATVVSSWVLGLSPDAVAIVGSCAALLSVFQHWNIRTPHALGFVLPRPEMHVLHHEYGIHGRNYGDLALWDLLFGTWENPATVADVRVGFDGDASARLGAMLLMRDVNAPADPNAARASITAIEEPGRPRS